MSLEAKIVKGVSWMAFFGAVSQAFSWTITIVIARILVPGDYGLMAMSTIIAGYALTMSELGLGNAIVQRHSITADELSSVFWFTTGLSVALAASCVPVSYLTAAVMREPRVIPLTQAVSVLFLLNGLQVIPSCLLNRRMDFKTIGLVEMVSAMTASGCMLVMAGAGAGVWTLLLGNVVRSAVRTILLFLKTRWRPTMHFNFSESRSFLSYGITIALGRSLFYVQEKSDRFFAGRAWTPGLLGCYTFALDLAQVPTDKIVSLINNVSFPAFCKLQNDPPAFAALYLNIAKITAAVSLPLFTAGFILGDDLIRLVLNPKWYPMIFMFRVVCLAQILTSMNALNNFVHAAQGRPRWSLYYNLCCVICMPASFAVAAPFGLNAMAVPWLSMYAALCVGWIVISLRKLGVGIGRYIDAVSRPLAATGVMSIVLFAVEGYSTAHVGTPSRILVLSAAGLAGTAAYAGYFWYFDRDYLFSLKKLTMPQGS